MSLGEPRWSRQVNIKKDRLSALSDILVGDGAYVYLTATRGVLRFDPQTGAYKTIDRKRITWLNKDLNAAPGPFFMGPQLGMINGAWRRQSAWLRPRKGGSQKCTFEKLNALNLVFNETHVVGYHVDADKWKRLTVKGSAFMGRKRAKGQTRLPLRLPSVVREAYGEVSTTQGDRIHALNHFIPYRALRDATHRTPGHR